MTATYNTDRLQETESFYEALGFAVVYNNGSYLHVVWPNNPSVQIGFLQPKVPAMAPVFQGRFGGEGASLGLEVDNVDALHDRLREYGIPIVVTLRDEPWGQRHFSVVDPNGVVLDFYVRIQMRADYQSGRRELAFA